MKKSAKVALGVTAAVAGVGGIVALAATEEQEPTQAAVCVDKNTNERLDDGQCDGNHHGGHFPAWYFIPFGYSAPRLGAPVSGGSFNTPQGTSYVTGGVPAAGGKVDSSTIKGGKTTTVRGGFGGKAGGSGS